MSEAINNFKSVVSGTPDRSKAGSTNASTATSGTTTASTKKPGATSALNSSTVSQDDFLNLLVNQLQHQDPLNPMDNQEFAVQLAQFSSLGKLIDIDSKLGVSAQGGAGSMAAYLGNEVAYADNQVRVKGGSGSNVVVDVPAGTQSIRVDLQDSKGVTVASKNITDAISTGQQVLKLDGLGLSDGKYQPRVVSVGSGGRFVNLDAKATGTVSGFVMEPEPKLLVGGEELAIAEVGAVYKGK